MFNLELLINNLKKLEEPFFEELKIILEKKDRQIFRKNPKAVSFFEDLKRIPQTAPSSFDFTNDCIQIGKKTDLKDKDRKNLLHLLKNIMPWRKGPFNLFDIKIDTEWQSNLKWKRLFKELPSLKGKKILDVGSSSGYYMFKMHALHPSTIIGLEPYFTYYSQYLLLDHYLQIPNIFSLPIRLEELPKTKSYFDIVFYMGIIYHSRSPFESLKIIANHLKRKGKLIIETIIMEDSMDISLTPKSTYAKMNNVFFIPSVSCLKNWLKRTGFKNITLVDISKTTLEEQRKTDWVNTESLSEFLDPKDAGKTIEGYPAPVRAILIAEKA